MALSILFLEPVENVFVVVIHPVEVRLARLDCLLYCSGGCSQVILVFPLKHFQLKKDKKNTKPNSNF